MPTKAELVAEVEELQAENEELKAREVATEIVEVPVLSSGEAAAAAAQAKLVESREYGDAVRRSTMESNRKRREQQHASLANPSGGR